MLGPHQLSHLRVPMYRLFHLEEGKPVLKHCFEVGLDVNDMIELTWGRIYYDETGEFMDYDLL